MGHYKKGTVRATRLPVYENLILDTWLVSKTAPKTSSTTPDPSCLLVSSRRPRILAGLPSQLRGWPSVSVGTLMSMVLVVSSSGGDILWPGGDDLRTVYHVGKW